jgi:hypothetical protein
MLRRVLAAFTAISAAGVLALGAAPAMASPTPPADNPGGRYIPASRPPGAALPNVATNVSQNFSHNWSGYIEGGAVSSGSFTAVKDTWRVPTVNTTPSGNQYSSDWVGIGGFTDAALGFFDPTLVQCGTVADNIGHTAVYHAWTEILPASPVIITTLTIHPKDLMQGIVQEIAANRWSMQVRDITTGKSFTTTVDYITPDFSAEAIHERPTLKGSLPPLAHDTRVTFAPGSYSSSDPGTTPVYHSLMAPFPGATVYQVFMTNNSGTAVIESPSVPDSDSDGFTVQNGRTSPPPPSS